jgi:SAM-dependent methyltransferase
MQAPAKDTYDAFASSYDDFNSGYMYERWTSRLLTKAEEAGLRGNRLLDVGCGTGLSSIPMLHRGWQVTGCDISPRMLEIARSKIGNRATLFVVDMRELPTVGQFDLVWAINDAINYLLSAEELEASFSGMRRNLAPEGILVFDVNTLATYRNFFSGEIVREEQKRRFVWRGQMPSEGIVPGLIGEAKFEEVGHSASTHVHRQRHFPQEEVLSAFEAVGLQCIGLFGELNGELYSELDEERHTKAVYLARIAK